MRLYVHSDIVFAIRKCSLQRWPWLWSGWLSHSVWRLEETRCSESVRRLKVWRVFALSHIDQGRNGFGWLTVSESGVTITGIADHRCEVMLLDDRTLEFHSQYGRHHRLRVPKCGGPRYPPRSKTISAYIFLQIIPSVWIRWTQSELWQRVMQSLCGWVIIFSLQAECPWLSSGSICAKYIAEFFALQACLAHTLSHCRS